MVVSFGPHELDLIVAAAAAIELGKISEAVWDDELNRVKAMRPDTEPPDDGVARMIEVTFGVSAVIGDRDDPPQVMQGTLVDVTLREMTAEDAAAHSSDSDSTPGTAS